MVRGPMFKLNFIEDCHTWLLSEANFRLVGKVQKKFRMDPISKLTNCPLNKSKSFKTRP